MGDHQVVEGDGSGFRCQVCGWEWKRHPPSLSGCPGVPIYWQWNSAPEHLLTQSQLHKKGLTVGPGAPVACLPNTRRNREQGRPWIWLYDEASAVPKKPLTPAQAAARDRAAEKRRLERTCARCGQEQPSRRDLYGGVCGNCHHQKMLDHAHKDAAAWARQMLSSDDWVVLDTETTGLDDAEAIQIAVIDPGGNELLVSLIRPIGEIGQEATSVHGITQDMVAGAPGFAGVYERLDDVLLGKRIVAYNADFDRGVIEGDCRRHGLPVLGGEWMCAMIQYSRWLGEWSDYWDDFRWQKLPNGDHSAAGDCRAVLVLMRRMAGDDDGQERVV